MAGILEGEVKVEKATVKGALLPNQQLDQIERYIIQDRTIPVLSEAEIAQLPNVKRSAYKYLTALQQGYNNLKKTIEIENGFKQHYYQILGAKHAKNIDPNQGSEYVKYQHLYGKSIQQLEQYMVNIALLTEGFSADIQRALGYEPSIIYIPDAENPVLYRVKSLEDILERGHLTKTSIHKTSQQMQSLVNSVKTVARLDMLKQLGNQNQINYLNDAYSKIIQRYNTYKYTFKKGKGSLILWVDPDYEWSGKILYQQGDLAETYANIVITRSITFTGITWPEIDIDKFMHKTDEVDSVSGFFEGDILHGSESIAVKANTASTQGIVLAIETAKDILNVNDNNIKQILEKKKFWASINKQGLRKGLRQSCQKVVGDSLQEMINFMRNK